MGELEDQPAARDQAEPTDVELVRAYRNGDVHAFEELHRRYVASIYRLVRRKLGDALLAEDIAQETFMKALRMMDKVDESFNFGGWVHTVARNLCFDELRRRQRDLRADGTTEEEDDELMANLPSTSKGFDPVLAPYLAGKLRRPQAEAVRDHIATCAKCTRKIGRRRLKTSAGVKHDAG